MVKKILFVSFIVMIMAGGLIISFAQDSKESLRNEAFTALKTATELMVRANAMIKGNPGKDDLKAALHLFAEAGRLYQKAEGMLKYLGPDYINQKDIDGCEEAINACLKAIDRIKKILNASG